MTLAEDNLTSTQRSVCSRIKRESAGWEVENVRNWNDYVIRL